MGFNIQSGWNLGGPTVTKEDAMKKMKVVLDKKIVVCGAVDITEEVKDKFKSSDELKTPEENIGRMPRAGSF